MHLRHVVPFLALLAWQIAPAPRPRTRDSRIRVSLGAGSSRLEYSFWQVFLAGGQCLQPGAGCDCTSFAPTFLDTTQVDAKEDMPARAVQVDVWPSDRIRASGAIGSSGDPAQPYRAGLLAWEGARVGLGLGWADAGAPAGSRGLAAYARLGAVDGGQLRIEMRTPTATPGATGWARAGFAYGQGMRGGNLEVYLGVAAVQSVPAGVLADTGAGPFAPRHVTRPAAFGDVLLPFSAHFGVFVRGHVARRERGLAGGVAWRF